MKIIHVFGLGLGKDFVAKAMLKVYAELKVKAKMARLNYETEREAANVIRNAEEAGFDVLILIGGPPAEYLGFEPWQAIQISGGRPLFKAGGAPIDADQDLELVKGARQLAQELYPHLRKLNSHSSG